MFIRRKPNKSGSFSVQILDKRDGRNRLILSMGSSRIEEELQEMERQATDYIARYGGQGVLDFDGASPVSPQDEADMFFNRIVDVRHDAPRAILSRIYDGVGFGAIGDEVLRSLTIARVCEPQSKVATVGYLKRCFREDYRLHQIYRYMDTLYDTRREQIQQISVEHTRKLLGGRIGIVFYDVTTLYFETAREDALRSPGFSKDGKTAESQIVLGLLVSRDGYPLSYNIFNGAQYEGRTMIPIIDDFVQRFSLTDFIVVADAGLLSRKNIALLKQAGYKFILGGRIKKESKSVQDWVLSLEKTRISSMRPSSTATSASSSVIRNNVPPKTATTATKAYSGCAKPILPAKSVSRTSTRRGIINSSSSKTTSWSALTRTK